jgi:RNA polymerase sigma factor (sigma-70 family)
VAEAPLGLVAEYLHRMAAPLTTMTDTELLARYAREGDGDAFAQLLRRHGPMVFGVCRRALGPTPDADDAFQATFIALARQSRRVKESVPGWLFRVAVRTSRRALRRADRAVRSTDRIDSADDLAALEWREVRRLLDEELNRLPDRWRSPLVLCYLDGLTRDEAARQLGWSLRTLHRRLDEGRQRLRARLVKRGLGPAVLAAAVLDANDLRCEVPAALVRLTADRTAHGIVIPSAIRTLIPRIPSTGGHAMKAVLSALVLVGVLAVTMGERQPSEAGPTPVMTPPPVLTRAPGAKDKPPEDELAKKVQQAQEKAIKYLKDQHRDEGGRRWTWEDPVLGQLQKGGPSALATLALLDSGVKPDDAALVRALKYLRSLDPENTYVVSLQTQAFVKANQKEDAERIKRNVEWLEKATVRNGAQLQGWSYTAAGGNRADHSNTRYAVAGLYAAHKVGFKVNKMVLWQEVQDVFVRTQMPDGGWAYAGEGPKLVAPSASSHTMTASGLLCLTLAKGVLEKEDKAGEAARRNGEAWVAQNFRLKNPPSTFYNLDVIAALGRASEKKDFGTKDKKIEWYRLGAEWLLENQRPDGSWKIDDALDRYPVISTSFALRFLASRPD